MPLPARFFKPELALAEANRYLVLTIMTTWPINQHEDGQSLLDALHLRVPSAPLGYLRQLCKKQRILLDAGTVDCDRIVARGEQVTVKPSERWQKLLAQAPLQPNQVLYEDDHCLIIDKPAGLATHHAQGHDDNLLQRVRDFLRLRGETFQVAPVHRLDRGTSGAILFGKGKKAIGSLGQLFMAGQITKHYLALVKGRVCAPGQLDAPVTAKGSLKSALTRFTPIQIVNDRTLLELELVTGRQHQIRQQLAASGHPLVGDSRYGDGSAPGERLMLHCSRLAFQNPLSGQAVHVIAPLDAAFRRGLAQHGLEASVDVQKYHKNLPLVGKDRYNDDDLLQ